MNENVGTRPGQNTVKKETRQCTQCLLPKALGEFYKNQRYSGGYQARCKVCVRAQTKKSHKVWRQKHPKEFRRLQLKDTHQHDYGLLPGEFEQVQEYQKRCCAICGRPLPKPHIDHNHMTGETRGLLCWPCNHALGVFHDDPILLRQAATYLEQFPVPLALGSRRFGLPGRIRTHRKTRRMQARDALTVGLVPADAYKICAPEIVPARTITTVRQKKLLHIKDIS